MNINHTVVLPSQWKKGTTLIADGKAVTVTAKPKKAIDGSWLVFWVDTDGKVTSAYLREENIQ
jgi:hypothetical protein